jgi:hypothetical protein
MHDASNLMLFLILGARDVPKIDMKISIKDDLY